MLQKFKEFAKTKKNGFCVYAWSDQIIKRGNQTFACFDGIAFDVTKLKFSRDIPGTGRLCTEIKGKYFAEFPDEGDCGVMGLYIVGFENGIIGLSNIVSGLLKRIEQLEKPKSQKFSIPSVSKIVGWKQKHIVYPTLQEIEDLEIKHADEPFYIAYRLLMYTRFLPSPASEKEKEVLKKIISLQDQYIDTQKG